MTPGIRQVKGFPTFLWMLVVLLAARTLFLTAAQAQRPDSVILQRLDKLGYEPNMRRVSGDSFRDNFNVSLF